MRDPSEQFLAALRERAIVPPNRLVADGKLHRCDALGAGGKGDAAYVLHLDGIPAGGFQNWRDGLGWQDWRADIDRPLTASQRITHEKRIAAARRERDAADAKRKDEARQEANRIWNEAKPAANDHPYLAHKGVASHGLREARGRLLVPLRDKEGVLHSLQFIAPDGGKRFLKDGRMQECFHIIGDPGDTLCEAEGYATCASIRQASGHAVAVAFNAGNLPSVAEALRSKFPDARIILCADDDYQRDGNPGLTKATEAARNIGGTLAVPDFGANRPDGAKDFNDLAAYRGHDAVKTCIARAVTPDGAKVSLVSITRADLIILQPIRWIWPDWIARGKFHLLAGAPGTGKTTLAIAFAAIITAGGKFPDGTQSRIGSVLMWSGEDDAADSIVPRFIANGGILSRFHIVDGARDERGQRRPFDPAMDFSQLATQAKLIPDLALIVVDPVVSAVLGDSYKNAEVRRALQPLVDFGADTGAAVLGISHYTKGTTGRDPVERVTGSLAFAAVPRLVMATAKPIEQGAARRIVRAKSNIGPDGGGFEYDMQSIRLEDDRDIYGQGVAWGQPLEGTARQLLADVEASDNEADAPAREEAEHWLRGLLREGPFSAQEIHRLADVTERKWRTVLRAKKKLGIVSKKNAMRGGWEWELPKDATATEECHTDSVASFRKSACFSEECHANGVATFETAGTLRSGSEVDIEL